MQTTNEADEPDRYEVAVDEAIAACGGDERAALKALLIATNSWEEDVLKGKRVQFDDETWLALEALARDLKRSFEELAGEAFADLLKKHDRPKTLKEALLESARREPANDSVGGAGKNGPKRRPRKPS